MNCVYCGNPITVESREHILVIIAKQMVIR